MFCEALPLASLMDSVPTAMREASTVGRSCPPPAVLLLNRSVDPICTWVVPPVARLPLPLSFRPVA